MTNRQPRFEILPVFLVKRSHGLSQLFIEQSQCFCGDLFRNAEECFGDAAGDAGQGVAVAAQGDGVADRVFEVFGLEEGDNRLGDRALAGDVVFVDGADLGQGSGEVVGELPGDELSDLF